MPMKLNISPDTLWLCLCAVPMRAGTRSRFLQPFFGQLFTINFRAQPISQLHVLQQAVPTEVPGVSLRTDHTTRRDDQRDHAQPLTSHAHHSPQQ